MSLLLSRMMTSFTLAFALVVGVAGVRLVTSEDTEIVFDSSYTSLLETPVTTATEVVAIAAPEMDFQEIRVPVAPKIIIAKKNAPKKIIAKKPVELTVVSVEKNELPFSEPVTLSEVSYQGELLTNITALYDGLPVVEKVLVADAKKVAPEIKDEVKTAQASTVSEEVGPEFFEYEEKVKTKDEPVEVAADLPDAKEEIFEDVKVEVKNIQTVSAQSTVPAPAMVGSAPANAATQDANLIAFDYSGLKQDIHDNKVPTVSAMTTHPGKTKASIQEEKALAQNKNALVAPSFESQMTIQGVATDLHTNETLRGFEVRFQDTAEAMADYGDGEVTFTGKLAHPKMTRSIVLLKRGFAPTNTDLILEDGAGSISIPVLSQELIDNLMQSHESNGAVGALLVELADETEKAMIDVPFGKVLTLDGDMRETKSEDFRYQLFIGVKAGNALLTYVHGNEVTNKIVHVHEREVTYESNFFEKTNINKISLWQEDLLSREKSPLITASENVKVFAKNIHGQKLNQNTYKIDFGHALLGGRNYVELTHEAESVFVGTRSEEKLVVPSGNFMRHILGSLPESKLGNRCVIQVNVKNKVSEVTVGAESVDQSLMTNVQFLDADGRFYDSASEKTRKVIVFGENQGSEFQELSGKVNLKISYQDGTSDYLGSYCSPNTYLVEQL